MGCSARITQGNSHVESERFHQFSSDELMARNKPSLDITWLKTTRWKTQRTGLRPR